MWLFKAIDMLGRAFQSRFSSLFTRCQGMYTTAVCISIPLTALGVLFIVTDVLILCAALNFPLPSVSSAGDFTTFQMLSIVSAVLAGIFSILCVPLLFLSCWVGIFNDSGDERSGKCCYVYLVLRVGSIANLLVQCILFSISAAKLTVSLKKQWTVSIFKKLPY